MPRFWRYKIPLLCIRGSRLEKKNDFTGMIESYHVVPHSWLCRVAIRISSLAAYSSWRVAHISFLFLLWRFKKKRADVFLPLHASFMTERGGGEGGEGDTFIGCHRVNEACHSSGWIMPHVVALFTMKISSAAACRSGKKRNRKNKVLRMDE